MCSAYVSWKKRGGDLIGQEEEPIKRPSLDVYNEPDKGDERWEPFWCQRKWRCHAWQGRRERRCNSVSRNCRQLVEELRVTRQKFAPKCLEERQEGSQVWWRKAQQRQPWFHFRNIHLRRRRCHSIFRHQIGNWTSLCRRISPPARVILAGNLQWQLFGQIASRCTLCRVPRRGPAF